MRIPRTDLRIPDPFYECPICKKGYWNLGNLSNHVKKKHPEHYTTLFPQHSDIKVKQQ